MTTSIKYSLKVWITTAFVAPFLCYLVDKIFSTGLLKQYSVAGTDGFLIFGILFGLIFSIPTFLILVLIVYILRDKTKLPMNTIKRILIIMSILLAILTLFINYYGHFIPQLITLFIVYPITTALLVKIFKLESL